MNTDTVPLSLCFPFLPELQIPLNVIPLYSVCIQRASLQPFLLSAFILCLLPFCLLFCKTWPQNNPTDFESPITGILSTTEKMKQRWRHMPLHRCCVHNLSLVNIFMCLVIVTLTPTAEQSRLDCSFWVS